MVAGADLRAEVATALDLAVGDEALRAIAFFSSAAKPMRTPSPMLVAPRIIALLPMRQSRPISTGPSIYAPWQMRVPAPIDTFPTSIAVGATSALAAM